MINTLIENINKSLDAEAYLSALSLALVLPDLCGTVEYNHESKVGKRYVNWYNNYIGKYEIQKNDDSNPRLSGEIIYQLRCSMLHEGKPNIDKNKIHEEKNKIDRFVLVAQKKNDFDIYSDFSIGPTITTKYIDSKEFTSTDNFREYRVNVRRLCLIICSVAKAYYEDNKDKFDFFNYEIIDYNEEVKRLNDYNMKQNKGGEI